MFVQNAANYNNALTHKYKALHPWELLAVNNGMSGLGLAVRMHFQILEVITPLAG